MDTVRLEERFQYGGGRVRREGPTPVIEGVLLCGPKSLNNRDYLREAFDNGRVKVYEGVPVRKDHDKPGIDNKLAIVENVRQREDGMPVGDLHVNPKHPFAESLLWAAEHKPSFYGMSHVADCRIRHSQGREQIYEIRRVESVDVVDGPATTKGLFRSEQKEKSNMPTITLTKFIEWAAPRVSVDKIIKLKTVAEMSSDMAGAVVPEPAEGNADKAVDTAFVAAMHELVNCYADGKCDAKDLLSKFKTVLTAHGKLAADPEKKPEESKEGDKDYKGKESHEPTTANIREAMDVFGKIGFKGFDSTDLETVAAAPANTREQLAKKLKLASVGGAEKPSGYGQGQGVADRFAKESTSATPANGDNTEQVKWVI